MAQNGSFSVGPFEIARVEDWQGPAMPAEFLLPGIDTALLKAHARWLYPTHCDPVTGMLIISIHSWVLRTRHHTILVDACVGNDKERRAPETAEFHRWQTAYLARLESVGVRPRDIDYVMCTHLHVDHCGWNTRLVDGRWAPTFPNARYIFNQREIDSCNPDSATFSAPDSHLPVWRDSIEPILEAGLAEIVGGSHAIEDHVLVEPAPGHTPGHAVLRLGDAAAGGAALFSGDIMHHALQVYAPAVNSRFCEAPGEARATRLRLLEELAESDTLLLPAHFGAPHRGRVRSAAGGFRFEFEH